MNDDEPKKSLDALIDDFTGDDAWGVQIGPTFPQSVSPMQQPVELGLPLHPPLPLSNVVSYKKTRPPYYPPRGVQTFNTNNNTCIPRGNNANRFCSKQRSNNNNNNDNGQTPPPPTKRVRRYQLTGPAPLYNNADYAYININTGYEYGYDNDDDDDALLQQVLELSLCGDGGTQTIMTNDNNNNEKAHSYNDSLHNTTSSCSTTSYQNANDTPTSILDIDTAINPLDDPLLTKEEREAMQRAMDESASVPLLLVDVEHEQALEEMRREWQREIYVGKNHLEVGRRPNNNNNSNHSVA